ncbi:MAG TPA: DUF4129 domain-containing protein [Anaerolineales bacterium]|nr:DUF4129 domain-containing protein [Anaerolineales bacterium]
MSLGTISRTTGHEKMFRRLSYLLVFLMMASSVLTIGGLMHTMLPDWHSGIIAAILLFIVIDRLYTYRGMKTLTPLSSEWTISIGAQWVVILVVMRLLLSYANGLDAFLSDLSSFSRGDLARLLTVEFVFSFLLALLIWFLTGQFLSLLDEIGLDQELALREELPLVQSGVVPARQRLVSLIFSLGIGLVVITALARLNLRNVVSSLNGLADFAPSPFSGGEAGTLLYFAFGLALLSLTRLMALQTRWSRNRIPVSSKNLIRQWGVYSVIFLVALVLIVGLLPAGDSLGFFSLLGSLLGFLFGILFFIGQLILLLLSLIFTLPLLLLRGEPVNDVAAPPPLPTMPPPGPVAPAPDNEIWMLIRSILLWGILVAIIAFALIQLVRQHGGVRAALRNSRLTNWLILAWQWLYRSAGITGQTLTRAIAEGWQTIVSRLEGRRILPVARLLNLRSLDPRRQIYFFYLAMVRRGAEQGVTRKPSQTPSEYAVQLEKSLPSAVADIDSITAAFVEARYSRREVDSGKANRVKATWGRIRRAFQTKARDERSSNK